ncbi:type II secretion system protein GspL [Cellvibrio sp. UBA7661]|uniref:type II secretion system protein GspL n=1 Tax=Cellvibrio sp. UBA7661 TaxID=1946311 RepID=UPI002F358552
MSMQLVLSVDTSNDGKSLADNFRWCWLGADGVPAAGASGDREALRTALGERPGNPQSAWLILPGSRVNTRELEYTEKEKKHLRNLLPFQLEDSVVGDVEELHFALDTPANGKVVVAFADKVWMQAAFAELAALGIEVTRCWTAPLTLPLAAEASAGANNSDVNNHWTLGLYQHQVCLRYARTLGFSIAQSHARLALQMLLREQERVDSLPSLHLRAANESDLALLEEAIPAELQPSIASRTLADEWALDFSSSSIDLCQGDFSQRLPIERWWKLWQSVAIFAGVCVAVYLGTLLFEIHTLGRENLKIRQQIEAVARSVIPQGRIVDPEKQLNNLLRQSQPVDQSVSVMSLLAVALPQIAQEPSVQVKGISFASESGELNFSIQAGSFSAFESLSQNLRNQGLNAETSSFNAQGNVQTARLRVTKNP